jgi:hypothetical protein
VSTLLLATVHLFEIKKLRLDLTALYIAGVVGLLKKMERYLNRSATGRAAQARQRAASREVKLLCACGSCLTSPAEPYLR